MADVTTVDFSQLQQVLSLVGERGLRALSELGPAIAESMFSEVMEVFEEEGAVGGNPKWAPFAWQRDGKPKPKGRRNRGSPKLLQDTGNLAGGVFKAWDDLTAEVYTNVPYARFHLQGTRFMPARDFFAFDRDSFEGDVADMLLLRLDRDVAA